MTAPHFTESHATPCPDTLEPARAQPCYEGADDQGEWMANGGKELLEGMLVVDCPEAAQ